MIWRSSRGEMFAMLTVETKFQAPSAHGKIKVLGFGKHTYNPSAREVETGDLVILRISGHQVKLLPWVSDSVWDSEF